MTFDALMDEYPDSVAKNVLVVGGNEFHPYAAELTQYVINNAMASHDFNLLIVDAEPSWGVFDGNDSKTYFEMVYTNFKIPDIQCVTIGLPDNIRSEIRTTKWLLKMRLKNAELDGQEVDSTTQKLFQMLMSVRRKRLKKKIPMIREFLASEHDSLISLHPAYYMAMVSICNTYDEFGKNRWYRWYRLAHTIEEMEKREQVLTKNMLEAVNMNDSISAIAFMSSFHTYKGTYTGRGLVDFNSAVTRAESLDSTIQFTSTNIVYQKSSDFINDTTIIEPGGCYIQTCHNLEYPLKVLSKDTNVQVIRTPNSCVDYLIQYHRNPEAENTETYW